MSHTQDSRCTCMLYLYIYECKSDLKESEENKKPRQKLNCTSGQRSSWRKCPFTKMKKKTMFSCGWFSRSSKNCGLSGRCLGWVGSSWTLSSGSKRPRGTRPSRRRPGIGCDSARPGTTRHSGWSGHRRYTTSHPSGNGHSYLKKERCSCSQCKVESNVCFFLS